MEGREWFPGTRPAVKTPSSVKSRGICIPKQEMNIDGNIVYSNLMHIKLTSTSLQQTAENVQSSSDKGALKTVSKANGGGVEVGFPFAGSSDAPHTGFTPTAHPIRCRSCPLT